MGGLNLHFRVINTIYPEQSLTATLYRSPSAHPSRFENLKNLQPLKETQVDKEGYGRLKLTEKDIEQLRSGASKVIHLAVSINHEKQPIFITGANRLAKLQKKALFAIDLKNDTIVSDYDPEQHQSDSSDDQHEGDSDGSSAGPGGDQSEEIDINARDALSLGERAREDQFLLEQERLELQEGIKEGLLKRKQRRGRRRGFIQGLLRKNLQRKRNRRGRNYVESDQEVGDKQTEAMKRSLERMGKYDAAHGMGLNLTEEQLKEWGIKLGDDWKTLTREQWEKIRAYLRSQSLKRRSNSILEECRKKHQVEQVKSSLESSDTDTQQQDQQSPAEDEHNGSLDEIFQTLCNDLLATIDTSKRPGRDEIAESVKQSITSGPADATAYYDFHTLTVAWEDTWTAVYDKYTEKEVAKVYDDIVELVGEDVAAEIENVEFDELNDFLESLSETVKDTQRTPGYRIPGDIKAWLPEAEAVWEHMALDDRRYLRFLRVISEDDNHGGGLVITSGPIYGVRPFGGARPKPGRRKSPRIRRRAQRQNQSANTSTRPLSGSFRGRRKFEQWMYDSVPDNVDVSDWARNTALNLIAKTAAQYEHSPGIGRLGRMLNGIHERLYKEPYEFDIFAPGSYNFGLLYTYQQRWKPLNYQAGELVSTMPLAPGERKTYSVKQTVLDKTSSTEKTTRSLTRSRDNSSMTRSQADIVSKTSFAAATAATVNTNFSGAGKMGLFNIKFGGNTSNTASGNALNETQQTRQDIRENTLKSAQEYKDERSLEVVNSTESTDEVTMTSEISNPNNEITVTYLFYELQRRFEVSSRLDQLRPVVMVAFEVPQPSEIDEDWLLTHDWILRRSLLDPSLAVALDYLRSGFTGDELNVEIYKSQWEIQTRVVAEIKDNVKVHMDMRDRARRALKDSAEMIVDKFDAEDAATVVGAALIDPITILAGTILGKNKISDAVTQDVTKEDIAAAQESARLGLEWANADLQAMESKQEAALYALQAATQDYVNSVKRRQQMRTRIDQLRIHVKENILHYMQAIWAHEHADQRYFRLYSQEVVWPDSDVLPRVKKDPLEGLKKLFRRRRRRGADGVLRFAPPVAEGLSNKRPLHEVADLDQLLGFKGNYAIFPMRDHNALTDYLSQDFLDSYFGVLDPDPYGNLPTETEAIEIAKCMWEQAGDSVEERSKVVEWLTEVLQNQIFVSDEVVVPTGQVFIEALPGSHPLLEDFKLRHRAVDMKKAQQGLMHSRIEALRRVQRLLNADLSDPDVDKNIQITGQTSQINVDSE